jgi:DNA helicase-2/ATP-dependent DNA helicase PcrA
VRAGDLLQLERIAPQFATRERFLTELALDPPQATSDLSGTPHLDEDYLVLSTIHSAKGQEWDAVFVLNVADGNFPLEFTTGNSAQIEEERRLLYVAMTRAKTDLHVLAPLRYYITQQPKRGDSHVYGARSRFMTRKVLAQFQEVAWPAAETVDVARSSASAPVDVAAKLRGMWT